MISSGSTNPTKERKHKKISRYSSICSQHFVSSDFSQAQCRKFLRKNAVPSITQGLQNCEKQADDRKEDELVEDPPGSDDVCGLCRSTNSTVNMDDYYFVLIRKCLPLLLVNENFIQKLCAECINQLSNFSTFIDKVTCSHDIITSQNVPEPDEVNVFRSSIGNIKVEPISNFEEESRMPHIQVVNFTQQSPIINRMDLPPPQFTPQKKCEILEIVDIKPFHSFDGSMQHESYDDEVEIQILSPKQLKVELTDPDEDGSNELELIRNYVYISTVFLKDHNYTKPSKSAEQNVKMEFDDDMGSFDERHSKKPLTICHLCHRSFKTYKKYLIHKSLSHQPSKLRKRLACDCCFKVFNDESKLKNHNVINCRRDRETIRKTCTKVIRKKKLSRVKRIKRLKRLKKACYSCPTCHKTFAGPKNLYQHKISHASSFYSCSLCDKKFKRPHGLKQHVKSIHMNEKSHICPICTHPYLLKADMVKCRHSKLKKTH